MSIKSFFKSIYPWLTIFTGIMCWEQISSIDSVRIPEAALRILLKDWGGIVSTFGSVLAVQAVASRIGTGIYTRAWLSGKGRMFITNHILLYIVYFNIVFDLIFLGIEFVMVSIIQNRIPLEIWLSAVVPSAYFRTVVLNTFYVWMIVPILNIVPSRYSIAFFILITLSHMPLEKYIPRIFGEELGDKIVHYLPDAVSGRLLDSLTEYDDCIPLITYMSSFVLLSYLTSRFTVRLKSS